MKHVTSSTRKSQFVRTLEYFRTADLDEATACLQSATEIVVERAPSPQRAARRGRKPRTNGAVITDAHITHTTGDEA